MKNALILILALFFALPASAQQFGAGGPGQPYPFNAPINGYAQNGTTVLNITNGSFTLPGIPQCLGNCDTLVGALAGSMLPSVDFLTTAVGFHACGSMTDLRTESTCMGWNAAGSISGIVAGNGHFITAYGVNALGNCVTCTFMTVMGTDAGRDLLTADHDVYLGNFTGNEANCQDSVGVGEGAMVWNITATGCVNIVAVGRSALQGFNTTTAHDLIGVGAQTLFSITSAFNGVAIGSFAGNLATTDSNFVFNGYHAGWKAVGTQNTTCVGANSCSGASLTATATTVVGAGAGAAISTGNNNSILGFNGCKNVATGGTNVCLGVNTGTTLTSGANNFLVGNGADVDVFNRSNMINVMNTWTALGTNVPATSTTTILGNAILGGAGQTVSTLVTCNSTTKGARNYVTDATAPTYGGALTAGGSVITPTFCNGSAWVSASNDNLKNTGQYANDNAADLVAYG